MQDRLDAINLVMREQLMGLTVIRAFTRERGVGGQASWATSGCVNRTGLPSDRA